MDDEYLSSYFLHHFFLQNDPLPQSNYLGLYGLVDANFLQNRNNPSRALWSFVHEKEIPLPEMKKSQFKAENLDVQTTIDKCVDASLHYLPSLVEEVLFPSYFSSTICSQYQISTQRVHQKSLPTKHFQPSQRLLGQFRKHFLANFGVLLPLRCVNALIVIVFFLLFFE